MRDREAVSRAIRRAPLFSSFTVRELNAVIEASHVADYEDGHVIFREGDAGGEVFLVVSGSVRVFHLASNGLEQPIATLWPGGCLGEMAFLDGGRRSATAVAASHSMLMRFSRQSMEVLEREFPGTRAKFLEQGLSLLSRRLRDSNSSYWELARRAMRTQMDLAHSRSRLLSLVSHELRTPLAIIKSSAQILHRCGNGRRDEFVDKILRQTDRLQILIDDLITLSLLQTDSNLVEATEFDCVALLMEVAKEFRLRAKKKAVTISVPQDTEPILVVADRALLRVAIRHLVDNAVKFSPGESRIQLDLAAGPGGEVFVSVSDEGEGVSEDALVRLRRSFVQSQSPLNRDIDGLGIGLSLVHDIIHAHDGKLLVDSRRGRGCRFTLAWPQPNRSPLAVSTDRRSVQNV